MDCWADLIWSSGWSEREERTHRDSNWALVGHLFCHGPANLAQVDYKALPAHLSSPALTTPPADPRTSNQWFVFEEFVPREYRDQLTNPKKKRNALGFAVKPKQWKPATTLNGKPYQSGMVPSSPQLKELEFDAMLKSKSVTRKISMGNDEGSNSGHGDVGLAISAPLWSAPSNPTPTSASVTPTTPKRPTPSPRGIMGSVSRSGGLTARFRIGSASKKGTVGSEYDPSLEFETRTASEASDDNSPDQLFPPDRSFGLVSPGKNHSRRQSKDDAWVDILVADQGRRMRDQDASFRSNGLLGVDQGVSFPTGSSSTIRRGRASSDPDMGRAYEEEADFTVTTAPVAVSPPSGYGFPEEEEVMQISRRASPDPAHSFSDPYSRDSSQYRDSQLRDSQFSQLRDSVPPDSTLLREPGSSEPPVPPGRRSYEDGAEEYEAESDFEPTSEGDHTHDLTSASRRDFTSASIPRSESTKDDDLTTSSLGQPIPSRFGVRGTGTGTGTVSSLIELYAERDRDAQAPKPSRLPVRISSKNAPIDEELVAPPVPPALEPGRASPSRYVHGAPLHNVQEEPDEFSS